MGNTIVMELGDNKTSSLVKDSLISLGYDENVIIKSNILDNDKIEYLIYNPIKYKGKDTFILRRISCVEYMSFIRKNLEDRGSEVYKIIPFIKRGKIYYNVICGAVLNVHHKHKTHKKSR